MGKLRSFLYLDNYKMYSYSSQLFEGLPEYIVKSQTEKTSASENQKGPIGSGRILADIIEKESSSTEKKFLNDYSFNLFEDALINQNKVLQINKDSISIKIQDIRKYSFIKVVGRVAFNDLKHIENTIKNFNSIGEALGYITMQGEINKQLEEIKKHLKSISDPNQRAKAESLLKSKTDLKKHLKEQNLYLEPEYLKHLAYVLEYGYNQQFEIQIPIVVNDDYYLFSAQLNRENLKDDEYRIIKKFSRESEKEFVLFGILTQVQSASEKEKLFERASAKIDANQDINMKEAIMNIISVLTNVEKVFTGKLDYEYIIDPISLYLEI